MAMQLASGFEERCADDGRGVCGQDGGQVCSSLTLTGYVAVVGLVWVVDCVHYHAFSACVGEAPWTVVWSVGLSLLRYVSRDDESYTIVVGFRLLSLGFLFRMLWTND